VKIYNYRVAHPAETLKGTPALASFFDGKQFECDKCINGYKAKYFAHDQAKIAGAANAGGAGLCGGEVCVVAACESDSITSEGNG